jgi:hypothetical protein
LSQVSGIGFSKGANTVKKMMIKNVATGLLMLLCGLVACADEIRVGAMTVTAPDSWYQAPIPSDEPYTRAVLASDSEPDDQALMIISVEPRNGRSLESLSSATRTFIATRMDGVLEYESSSFVDGAPAHTFVYEGRSEHQGRRKFMRTIVEKGNSFYILHGVANHIPFAGYAGTLEGVVKSLRWKN